MFGQHTGKQNKPLWKKQLHALWVRFAPTRQEWLQKHILGTPPNVPKTLAAQTLPSHVSCLYQFKSCEVPQQITDSCCSARVFQGDLCTPHYPELSASVTVSIRVKSNFFKHTAIKDKTSWCLENFKQTAFQHLQGWMRTQESNHNGIHTPQVIKLTFLKGIESLISL